MSIVIPPELNKMINSMSHPAGLTRSVGRVVSDSKPATGKPPKFGSLVNTTSTGDGKGFTARSTGVVAAGAEFGGRRRPKRGYLTHRKGRSYSVRRRTTMQFLPFNQRGYALVPAMRHSMAGIRERILKAVSKEASGS